MTTADSVADGNCVGWAARDTTGKLSPYKFNRRQVGADEVAIKITYAGMCHSDIHSVRGEWPGSRCVAPFSQSSRPGPLSSSSVAVETV